MSLSTLRKNFYRIATLIIDHGAESMRCLLDQFIQTKYRISFRDFVSNHQHEMYHHFNNGICCLCSKNYRRPHKTVISAWQMEKLFDKNSPKLSCHKYSSKCDYCCSTVRSTLIQQDIDITLLRFFLVTYFEEEFWQSCFTSGMLFHDFLNTHKHDIFHLLQLNTPCCICIAHLGYTTMVLNEKDRLNRTQWETMFHTSEFPCIQHRNYCPNGYTLNPCSVSATIGIHHSDLDGRARMIILSKFCTMMRHIDELVNARNTSYAHAIKGELSNEEFRQLWDKIENSIVYISNITNTVDSRKLCILELREKSLEKTMCLELQSLILKQMYEDEHVLQACHKLQDTVEMVKEVIDLKLQQIEMRMSDVVRNELSVQLNEYSDTTRNIIDNTRREIEFHDEDKTYVETCAVTAATELLTSKNLLIIFGRAGSGKTSTALEIASKYRHAHDEGCIIMKLEQNLAKKFKTYFISKKEQLIIFEDLFGKTDIRYNKDIHSDLLEILKPYVYKGVSKFIITVRSYKSEVDNEIGTYHTWLSEAGVVNLNESLSYLEKKRILTMHAAHNGLEIGLSEMQNIVATNSYLGFPEASSLFCSFEKFFAMGHAFFISPTKELQKEINVLKRSGYMNIDSALKYCVLVGIMMDSACKDSFGKNISRVAHKRNDRFNNYNNINCSVIEHLYHSLFNKEIRVTIDELDEMCEELTNKYIKEDLHRHTYIFQHQTVFEAVLSSYWHYDTMEDVIKYFKADILAEHFRPFDSTMEGCKKYLNVPVDKCTDMANKMFETLLANYKDIFKCYSLVKQSEFTLNLFNLKLDEWNRKEENILKCNWNIIANFIRPFNYKKAKNIICANADDKYLIKRLINELDNRARNVDSYIKTYGSDEFSKQYNAKVKERFQLEENVRNCDSYAIELFIRPTSFTIENGQIGTVTNDEWLIQRLVNMVVNTVQSKRTAYSLLSMVKKYITEYGCITFVNIFNEKLRERFQLEENVRNCDWYAIEFFIRPTSFTIENSKIGTVTNDDWLIQRIIDILVNPRAAGNISNMIEKYITDYGCIKFVNIFNEKLREWFQSKENVVNCDWYVLTFCIRPTTFTIENGQIGTVTNDDWLIQRIIDILVNPEACKLTAYTISIMVHEYITDYGSIKFVNIFNEKLREWFQSKENVVNCDWYVLTFSIRPTTFTIENGQIGTVTNDDWLIQRIINILVNPETYKPQEYRILKTVKKYIKKYGCIKSANIFNEKLRERFQSEENVENCNWYVIKMLFRPSTFIIENSKIGTVTNDNWLIQRIIDILVNIKASGLICPTILPKIHLYITKYGSEQFVNIFNEKLRERFQSEENEVHFCWYVIKLFIRPTSFTFENGQIGTVTNDDLLTQRIIDILLKSKSSNTTSFKISNEVKTYITEYGCKKFVNIFNEKLRESVQSEKNVVNCNLYVIKTFIRPTTVTIENGQIGTITNDDWLIQRIIDILVNPEASKLTANKCYNISNTIQKYITDYGCIKFVNIFNEKLRERFRSKENVVNCVWYVIQLWIRPTTFTIENGKIGIVTNDDWLIQRMIDILVNPEAAKLTAYRLSDMFKEYMTKYGCIKFVNIFNEKLRERFQSKENVVNCVWYVIQLWIRPTTFTIKNGKIGTVTNDDWLIQRIIDILVNPEASKSYSWTSMLVRRYITKFGSSEFKANFNERLKKKVESIPELHPEFKWKYLEQSFDYDNEHTSSEDTDSVISECGCGDFILEEDRIWYKTSSEDSESDSNIDNDAFDNS